MSTLVLTRSDVVALLEPVTLLENLKQGFILAKDSTRTTIPPLRARSDLPGNDASATALFPGLLPGIPAYSVKVQAKFPQQSPAIRGLLQLFDLETGALLAVMDSGYLTALRTAAAGAVAADALAKPDASRVALIGAGAQNALGLSLLSHVRDLRSVSVYDTAPLKTGPFVRRLAPQTDANLLPADTLAEALEDADIVVCATWARTPFLYEEMLAEGAHVTTLGADEPGKAEISAELLLRSRVFCDHSALAVQMGAVGNVGLGSSVITGELGEVLEGRLRGRLGDETTVYGGVGLPWMDLVAAWAVYRTALEVGRGQKLDFSA